MFNAHYRKQHQIDTKNHSKSIVVVDLSKNITPSGNVLLTDAVNIFYTSGFTGLLKFAVSNHKSILTTLNTWLMLDAAAGIANSTENVEPVYPQVALMTVPLFNVTGCHTLVLLSMLIGRKR